MPVKPLPLPPASRWMKFGFSMSKRSGTAAVPWAAPSPGAERVTLLTSWVETKPADAGSNRKLTPLPVTIVLSPPPPVTALAGAGGAGADSPGSVGVITVADPDAGCQVRAARTAEVEIGGGLATVADQVGRHRARDVVNARLEVVFTVVDHDVAVTAGQNRVGLGGWFISGRGGGATRPAVQHQRTAIGSGEVEGGRPPTGRIARLVAGDG